MRSPLGLDSDFFCSQDTYGTRCPLTRLPVTRAYSEAVDLASTTKIWKLNAVTQPTSSLKLRHGCRIPYLFHERRLKSPLGGRPRAPQNETWRLCAHHRGVRIVVISSRLRYNVPDGFSYRISRRTRNGSSRGRSRGSSTTNAMPKAVVALVRTCSVRTTRGRLQRTERASVL